MSGYFRAVRPMSAPSIERAATQLRKLLGLEADARVQMVNLIETVLDEVLPDYLFYVMPDEEMSEMDGITAVGSYTICLAEHTYVELCSGCPEARLVAAHELGHLILHSHQQSSLARRTFNDDRVDPEWQADKFAEFWLLPTAGVAQCKTPEEVAERFTAPIAAARRRFSEVLTINCALQGELF